MKFYSTAGYMSSIKEIRKRMKDMQLSNVQLAQHLKQPTQLIDSWLNGHKKIPYTYLWGICDLLCLDACDFMKVR